MTRVVSLSGMLALVLMFSGCEREEDPYRRQADNAPGSAQEMPAPADVAEAPADAQVTNSGLAYVILEDAGGHASPRVSDTVTVHYTGWTTDGQMFDSSVVRGEPATFPLDRLIPGWQEAIPLMKVGDTFRFWIPGHLAYDNSPRPDAPRGTLVFDIQLIAMEQEDVGGGTQDEDTFENRSEQL